MSESIRIRPRPRVAATVWPPGSKSITNRALVAAALAQGESVLVGALHSDDTTAMRGCLASLGVIVEMRANGWVVAGTGGRFAAPSSVLDAGASGTTARFVTALASLANGPATVTGTARMRQRPISELVDAINALGGRAVALGRGGCPPVRVQPARLRGGGVVLDASRSSQFASAIMLVAPYAAADVHIQFEDGVVVSRPYLTTTIEVMTAFGASAALTDEPGVVVRNAPTYRPRRYAIEPDASAAVYAWMAAAATGGRMTVQGMAPTSTQADLMVLDVLEAMGCQVIRDADGITVAGGDLVGVDVDMVDAPDGAMAIAVLAALASGDTTVRGLGTLRLKETDRIAALATELRKLGASVEAGPDVMRISPGPLSGATIDTYDDHRIAMAFAVAGLTIDGVVINDPGCVSKTWPGFFDELESWGSQPE